MRFHIFLNLQYLIYKIFEGFGAKLCVHVNMDLSIAKIPIPCTDSQILRAFFSKSTFHQSVMTPSMKLPYLKNAMSDFIFFSTKIDLKEQPFRKWQNVHFVLLRHLVPFDVLRHICSFYQEQATVFAIKTSAKHVFTALNV